jgi:hypothetical protein
MSSISSIENSLYPQQVDMMFPVMPMDTMPKEVAPIDTSNSDRQDPQSNPDYAAAKAAISNYYNVVKTDDFNTDISSNVTKSAQDLNNAMLQALSNGLDTETATNMQRAKAAYMANINVFNIYNDTMKYSTFEIEV